MRPWIPTLLAAVLPLLHGQSPTRVEYLPPKAPAQEPVPPVPDVFHDGVPVPAPLPADDAPMLDFARAAAVDGAPARFAGPQDRLSFVGGDWAPAPEQRIDPELQRRSGLRAAEDWLYAFVILHGQDSEPRMRALREVGVEPIEFHPYSAYKVRLRPGAESLAARLPFVRWIGFAQRWQRISPELRAVLDGGKPPAMVAGGADGTLALYVTSFDSDRTERSERFFLDDGSTVPAGGQFGTGRAWRVRTHGSLERAIAATGARVAGWYDSSKCFLVHATPAQVQAILDLDRVHYVEIAFAGASDHDQSIPLVSQDEVRGVYPGGGNVIAGIIDSGVDVRHGDLSIFGWGWDVSDPNDPAPWTDVDGHGTHVAGTILGRGVGRAELKGNAAGLGYDATHRFLNVRLNRGTTWGSALDAFNYMATGGGNTPKAMVVNCSWHTSTSGYGTDAVSVDADARAFQDGILWIVAAGNRGTSGGSTINSPAAAKNVLAVANVQDEDGAYDANGNWIDSGNAAVGRVANTSSQGPADDGRIKPNLAAPGRWIDSTKAGTVASYADLSGTSMAAPHVTGVAASLMQHYTSLQGRPHFLGAKLMANAVNRSGAFIDALPLYGFGKINAYRSHWSSDAAGGWVGDSGSASIRPGVGATIDLRQVPSDCTQIWLVTWHIESAPSTGGGNAVKNNVDVYVDRPPYSNGTDTGEYSSRSVLDNIERVAILGSDVRGQVLRLKLHPTSIRAGETVHVGYQCVMLRGSVTPAASVSLVPDKPCYRPSDAVRLTAEIDPDAFFALNVLNRMSVVPAAFTFLRMEHALKDGTQVIRSSGSQWQTLGDVRYNSPREIVWVYRAPNYDLGNSRFEARFFASNVNQGGALIASVNGLCVDGSAPTRVGNLASSSHARDAWTNGTRFAADWTHATDTGCAGVAGYSYVHAVQAQAPAPDFTVDTAANGIAFDVGASDLAHWFAIRTLDRSGNYSSVDTYRFYVDTSKPVFSAFAMAGNATHTRSRLVSMDLTATDTYSGVDQMRFSNDGQSWSPWMQFQAQVVNWDLITGAGGSDKRGDRTIWAQVKDKAGNMPPSRSTSVIWDDLPPAGNIRLNDGAQWTANPRVTIGLTFQDQHSVLARMRFSNDGMSWSQFEPFATTKGSWDLAAFGGSSSPGIKTVHCEVEDAAANRSAPATAQIQLLGAPTLATIAPARTTTLRHPEERIRLTGLRHEQLTEAVLRKGAMTLVVPLGMQWSLRGRLVDLPSPTDSELFLPKPIEPGAWTVALRNPAGESPAIALQLDLPATPTLDAPAAVQVGKDGFALVSAAPGPGHVGVLFLSFSGLPSRIPGLVDLEIGDQFRQLMQFGGTFPFSSTSQSWLLDVGSHYPGSLVGMTLFSELVVWDARNLPPLLPLLTTNAAASQFTK